MGLYVAVVIAPEKWGTEGPRFEPQLGALHLFSSFFYLYVEAHYNYVHLTTHARKAGDETAKLLHFAESKCSAYQLWCFCYLAFSSPTSCMWQRLLKM